MEVLERINLLNNDIEKCCTETEERHDLSLFLKGNAMRKAVKEKNALIEISRKRQKKSKIDMYT